MKLNLLSLMSFFTIAITANGQLRRGGEQELVATLDLDDAHMEFFDGGDGILIVGTTSTNSEADREKLDLFSTALIGLSPVEIFEQLSRKPAPADLVNAQNRVEKLVGTPSSKTDTTANPELDDQVHKSYRYNQCVAMPSMTGDFYYAVTTNKIGGRVEPLRGCVNIKTEKWNGRWHSGRVAREVCAGDVGWVEWWAIQRLYSVDIFKAEGDKYDLTVCYD
jgi:hypothetical protein